MIYAHLRLRNLELHKKIKIRAAQENTDIIEVTEKAIKDYLKKPLAK